jgi:transposase
MAAPWQPTGRLEIVPKRQSRDEPDVYSFQGLDVTERLTLSEQQPDGTTVKKVLEIPARAIRVHSTALVRIKTSTRARLHEKEARQAQGKIREWHNEVFKCPTDAERAAQRRTGQNEWVTLNLHAEVIHREGPAKRGRGRPRQCPEPELAGKEHWRVRYTTSAVDQETTDRRLHEQATFILIRTRNKDWNMSDEDMIRRYKDQHHVEGGFAWLKSTAAINPLFLHTAHRIAALCFIYCLGLIIWNLIQRTVRNYLKQHNLGLPYHRGKPSPNITTRFLFELFPQVQTVPTTIDGKPSLTLVGFGDWQRLAAKALGTHEREFRPVMAQVNSRSPKN